MTTPPHTPSEYTGGRFVAGRAFRIVGVILPLVILIISGIIVAAWLPDVPAQVAVHWSGAGPDGFGPAWMSLLPIGLGVLLVLLFAWGAVHLPRIAPARTGPASLRLQPQDQPQMVARLIAAVNLALAVMMGVTAVAATGVQRGLADAALAPDIGGWVAAGAGLGAVVGVIGWFLRPMIVPVHAAEDTSS